jgi:hypothetical protein
LTKWRVVTVRAVRGLACGAAEQGAARPSGISILAEF